MPSRIPGTRAVHAALVPPKAGWRRKVDRATVSERLLAVAKRGRQLLKLLWRQHISQSADE